jgi:cytochrome P450
LQLKIFGVVVGGYDTTSTALCWAVKLLADNQGAQNKIRNTLRAAYLNAVAEGRAPTATEIVETPIPYIDASVEEIIRHSLTQPSVLRITTQDVDVLGHTIPKGTTILMMGNGPSFMTPGLEVDEDLRSPTSRTANNRIGAWDPKDIHLFKPERWLIEEDDKIVFNPSAGPHLTFGLGVRGCFGRKLATLQMKIAVTLIVWNFIIQKVPDELGGYAAHDALTHLPQQCYLRLAPVA